MSQAVKKEPVFHMYINTPDMLDDYCEPFSATGAIIRSNGLDCKYLLPCYQRSRLRSLPLTQSSRSYISSNPLLFGDDTRNRRQSLIGISTNNIDGFKASIYPRHSIELAFVNPTFSKQTMLSPNRRAGSRRSIATTSNHQH